VGDDEGQEGMRFFFISQTRGVGSGEESKKEVGSWRSKRASSEKRRTGYYTNIEKNRRNSKKAHESRKKERKKSCLVGGQSLITH